MFAAVNELVTKFGTAIASNSVKALALFLLCFSRRAAITPATYGVAIDVPDMVLIAVVEVIQAAVMDDRLQLQLSQHH